MIAMAVLAQAGDLNRVETAFVRLVDQALSSPALMVVAIAAAFGVGAVHALAPGHGKAVAGAYLVGGRGTVRDALLLGVTVALMHSASVLVLGFGLQALLRSAGDVPSSVAAVTPGLRVASGVAVTAVGVYLLTRSLRGRHRHHHGDRTADPPASPFTRRGLVVLGMSGGLLPSPSAFLVLVTTSFMGRAWLGLLLVATFSLGLAATLTLVGVAAVRGREVVVRRLGERLRGRTARRLAWAAAVVVFAGGVVMTVAGVAAL